MKENQVRHVCWMYIYTAYSIRSISSAYRKSIVVARYIWKQMNVAKKTVSVVSTTENYQCSQAVIGQLCIVSYRWLANSIMGTIIVWKCEKLKYLVVMLTNTNDIREEFKRRINTENAYYSLEKILSSSLISARARALTELPMITNFSNNLFSFSYTT